jgi:hypothetical protein
VLLVENQTGADSGESISDRRARKPTLITSRSRPKLLQIKIEEKKRALVRGDGR